MTIVLSVLRWVTIAPAVLAAGWLARVLTILIANWSALYVMDPDSSLYVVARIWNEFLGSIAAGAAMVFLAWLWAPGKKIVTAGVTAALMGIVAIGLLTMELWLREWVYVPGAIAVVVGVVAAFAYIRRNPELHLPLGARSDTRVFPRAKQLVPA